MPLNLPSNVIKRDNANIIRTLGQLIRTMGVITCKESNFKSLLGRQIGVSLRRVNVTYRTLDTRGLKDGITMNFIRDIMCYSIHLPVHAMILYFLRARRRTYVITTITIFICVALLRLSFIKSKVMIGKSAYVPRGLCELCGVIDRNIMRVLTIFVLNGNMMTRTIYDLFNVYCPERASIVLAP